jgi:hypothetical protein
MEHSLRVSQYPCLVTVAMMRIILSISPICSLYNPTRLDIQYNI